MAEKSANILESLKKKQMVDSIPAALGSIFRKSVQPFLISMMDYDPCREVAAISVPILILQGDNDIQVGMVDAKRLAESNKSVKFVSIAKMNHVLKICGTSISENYKSYYSPAVKISDQVSSEISFFLKENKFL